MTTSPLSDTEILALEERQLLNFLKGVRPVGEEKSELYPEPQYFQASFMVMLLAFRGLVAEIAERGGAPFLAARMQRVLGRATALHVSTILFVSAWAREMWRLDAGDGPGTGIATGKSVTDAEFARIIRFGHDWAIAYRQDGRAYPSDHGALGDNYRILTPTAAQEIAAQTVTVDPDNARAVLRLWGSVRSLSFVMEAETRDALMMHGPYPTGRAGEQLVVFECIDLRWSLFPSFPIPGGQRWELPEPPFPYPNLAIAFVLRDCTVNADRFGTLYVDPWQPENIVTAQLFTRDDASEDGAPMPLGLTEIRTLARACDDIQDKMFLQIANWEPRQRLAAGHFQKMMVMVRTLSCAGIGDADLPAWLQDYFDLTEQVWGADFDRIFETPPEDLPFYKRLGDFMAGKSERLFTPYSQAETG